MGAFTKAPLQQMNKTQERNVLFTIFTGYHGFITLGKQSDDYSCKPFTLSGGGEHRGCCAISQQDLHFFQTTHEAHGLHVYWQAEEAHPAKPSLAVLRSSMLMPFGNTVQGIFSSALMCPLKDSSAQRSSHLDALFSL